MHIFGVDKCADTPNKSTENLITEIAAEIFPNLKRDRTSPCHITVKMLRGQGKERIL